MQSEKRKIKKDSIFNLMPISLLNKIPANFRNMINIEKATDY